MFAASRARFVLCSMILWGCTTESSHTGRAPRSTPAPAAPEIADPKPPLLGERFGDMALAPLPTLELGALSADERSLLFTLQEALLSGRDIAYVQSFRENLAVRTALEAILDSYRGNRQTQAFEGLRQFAKQFYFAGGLHHPITGEKLQPELTASQLAEIVQNSDPHKLPLAPGESVASWLGHVTPLLYAPDLPRESRDPDDDGAMPPSGGRDDADAASQRMVEWLKRALPLAHGSFRDALAALITYVQTGDREAWEAYVAAHDAHVSGTEGRIDLAMGPLAPAHDAQRDARLFAGVLSVRADAGSEPLVVLRDHAAALEARLPLPEGSFVPLSGPLRVEPMQLVLAAGGYAARPPTSLRLPGAEVTLSFDNARTSYLLARVSSMALAELSLTDRELRRGRMHGEAAQALFTQLRDLLGRQVAAWPGRAQSEADALREHGPTLLSARADLIALYLAFDAQLIELDLLDSFDVSRTLYDAYTRDALLTSLLALSEEDTIPQDPNVRGARLVMQWTRAQSPLRAPSVQRVLKAGDTYFEVTDYLDLRKRFGQLLVHLQRILAEGDYDAADALVEQYAEPVEAPLRRQVRERLAPLGLPSAVGLSQPRLSAELDGTVVREVSVRHVGRALDQALSDAHRYGSASVATP